MGLLFTFAYAISKKDKKIVRSRKDSDDFVKSDKSPQLIESDDDEIYSENPFGVHTSGSVKGFSFRYSKQYDYSRGFSILDNP